MQTLNTFSLTEHIVMHLCLMGHSTSGKMNVYLKWVIYPPLFIVWCRLKPFEAALKLSFAPWTVWFPLKSIIWRKSWNVFIKNLNLFSNEDERRGHLGWHGGEL